MLSLREMNERAACVGSFFFDYFCLSFNVFRLVKLNQG